MYVRNIWGSYRYAETRTVGAGPVHSGGAVRAGRTRGITAPPQMVAAVPERILKINSAVPLVLDTNR